MQVKKCSFKAYEHLNKYVIDKLIKEHEVDLIKKLVYALAKYTCIFCLSSQGHGVHGLVHTILDTFQNCLIFIDQKEKYLPAKFVLS